MYAIIRTGGKQYKVEPGDTLRVEKLDGELGAELDLKDVLLVGGDQTFFGQPIIDGAKVTVVVTHQTKAPKVIVFKKKRRQGYRRLQGHRQYFTELFVKSITAPDGETLMAKTEAHVFDPKKREEKLKARKEKSKEAVKAEPTKGAAKKKTAAKTKKKKVAKKKTAAKKKSAAKKKKSTKATKTAKKTATKKKTAKKKKTTGR